MTPSRNGAVAVQLVIIAIVLIAASWYIHASKAELVTEIEKQLEKQHTVLISLAEITDRNGADAIGASIIQDCRERSRFEELLGRLGSLQSRELIEVQQLFEACGNFYAMQKGFMVARLEREFEILRDAVLLYAKLKENITHADIISSWESLVSNEMTRSALLKEQVSLQREIISLLISGSRINSTEVTDKVKRAEEIMTLLKTIDIQADELRLGLQDVSI